MRHAKFQVQTRSVYSINVMAVAALSLILTANCFAQSAARYQPENPLSQELNKYPGLLPEIGKLIDKLQHNVQFPPVRNQSSLLPLLPPATTYYAAFPNYGEPAHQALMIFRQQLQDSPVLRDWWQHGNMALAGPQIEDSFEKFYELSQYLGDEIVVSGDTGETHYSFAMMAEVRKPGLKDFLRQTLQELPGQSKPLVRVLDLQQLASAKGQPNAQEIVILVRPDFVLATTNLDTLRNLNQLIEKRSKQFASTPFGQRLTQEYQEGASVLVAADLHHMLGQIPQATQNQEIFDRTGFQDVKYFVWEHKTVTGQPSSQMELSFNGPRHGLASWLGPPAPLNSLDFVSPKAVLAATVVLKNLGEIFDDVRKISTESNPSAFAMISQMEQATNVNLRDDLLSHLEGEITLELDDFVGPKPVWKAILKIDDTDRLQQSLNKLLSATQIKASQSDKDGVSYHTVVIPSQQDPAPIAYAFIDKYLVIGSSQESAAEGVRVHKSGESLAKSTKFLASLPREHSLQASGLLYEDPIAMMSVQLQRMSPGMAETISHLQSNPAVVCAYGEDSAIRAASNGGGADASAVLVMAGIAIPNVLRAKMAANEATAAATIRTINAAHVAYAATYPQRGYARDLAALGSAPQTGTASPEHASMLGPR